LDKSRHSYEGSKFCSTIKVQIYSTNIPELLGNAIPKKCKKCGKVVPEILNFVGVVENL